MQYRHSKFHHDEMANASKTWNITENIIKVILMKWQMLQDFEEPMLHHVS